MLQENAKDDTENNKKDNKKKGMKSVSIAAEGLRVWLNGMIHYNDTYIKNEPIIKTKEKLEADLKVAT